MCVRQQSGKTIKMLRQIYSADIWIYYKYWITLWCKILLIFLQHGINGLTKDPSALEGLFFFPKLSSNSTPP